MPCRSFLLARLPLCRCLRTDRWCGPDLGSLSRGAHPRWWRGARGVGMNLKATAGMVIGLLFLFLFLSAVLSLNNSWPSTAPARSDVGVAKWGPRSFEVLLQGIILLAGVVAIILLLGSRKFREVRP
ncbi:MAG: hypothetical protein ABR887_06680 [Methanoregulaceae archaeon]